ncbi:MAG: hypothetical protein AAB447_04055 [Patescibacteria group bacterium]|mgnify:CR=1 FL=1
MKYIRGIFFGVVMSMLFLVATAPSLVWAETTGNAATETTRGGGLPNPLGQQNGTIYDFVKSVLAIFLKIGIFVAAVAFIYSGFLFVTAQGNSEKRTEASNAFFNTVLGTALLLGAWGLAQIIKATINGIVG